MTTNDGATERTGDDLQHDLDSLFEWAWTRGLTPREFMVVTSFAIGMTVRAGLDDGMPYEAAMALIEQAQQGLLDGAQLPSNEP